MSGERLRASRENLLVVLATGLFAAVLCFVRPTIFESADYVLCWKPIFQFLADAVRAGEVPLWNPYIGLGRPFLADMTNAVLYPPMYLVCTGEKTGVFLLVWLHCLLAVFGMGRLTSALQTGRWQSHLMAFSFLASGALTARWTTGQLTYTWAICYVPWLFYCAIRTEEPWQGRHIALYALFLAMQFLCGHPQVFWFSAIGQAVFILTRALRFPLREAIRDAGQGLCQFGAACVWCAGLVATALLPMLELIEESNRSDNSPAFVNAFNLSWADLACLFSPLYPRLSWESNVFVGAMVVISGCAGLCLVRERNVRGLLGVMVVALLIALGDRTPAFGLFYKWLPGFASFRIHARAALLVVLVLICAAGIWLSRPHHSLRSAWTYIFCIPIRYALIGLVLLQSVDLLGGAWEIKRIITSVGLLELGTPVEHSFLRSLPAELRKAGLLQPLRPPPRVCVSPSFVPLNYGMIYHYSNFDADCSLFLRRPWDYLHTMLGIPPGEGKGYLSPLVYSHGLFPYFDLGLAAGLDPGNGKLVVNTNSAPRAFLVSAAAVTDYATILDRLAHGYDIHQSALLEKPLAEPLPKESFPHSPASIRRFEPDSLLIEVESKEKALLVLAEAWYPGWRAEIDGRVATCLAANLWMRAVPVPAGRHQVRLYFRQHYLLPGLLISLASASLLLAFVLAKPARRADSAPEQHDGIDVPTAASAEENGDTKQEPQSLPAPPSAFSRCSQMLRALASGLLLVWLIAMTAILRVRSFNTEASTYDSFNHFQRAEAFTMQHQTAQAIAQYTEGLRVQPNSMRALNNLAWIRATSPQAELRDGPEAVRLAKRACELSDYKAPLLVGTLAAAYAEAGRFNEAVTMAATARELALATGESELADRNLKLIEIYKARQPFRDTDQRDERRTGKDKP